MLSARVLGSLRKRVWGARYGIALACALVPAASSRVALAQSAADRTTARALADEGAKALESQQYAVAEDRFRRADALVHAPTFVVAQGQALIGLGRLIEAYERFQLVLREEHGPDAHPSWELARQEAAKLSEQVQSRIAWLTVSVEAAKPAVRIDGKPIPSAAIGVPRAVDPGTRELTVGADGCETRTLRVRLDEGAHRSIRLVLQRKAKPKEPARRPASVIAQPKEGDQPSPILAYGLLGVGGGAILIGSIAGILTLDKKSSLDAVCVDKTCPPSATSDVDDYNTLGTTSGIALGVGVASTAAGILLLTQPSRASEVTVGGIQLRAGLGGLQVRGAFQ